VRTWPFTSGTRHPGKTRTHTKKEKKRKQQLKKPPNTQMNAVRGVAVRSSVATGVRPVCRGEERRLPSALPDGGSSAWGETQERKMSLSTSKQTKQTRRSVRTLRWQTAKQRRGVFSDRSGSRLVTGHLLFLRRVGTPGTTQKKKGGGKFKLKKRFCAVFPLFMRKEGEGVTANPSPERWEEKV